MWIKGCGVDLVEIHRIQRAILRERFRERVYTPREREYLEHKHPHSWAARFAAKEAVMKALGTGWQRGVGFDQIEIVSDSWGKPAVHLTGKALELAEEQGIHSLFLSLSHSGDYAVAYVIAVGKE